MLLTYKNLIYSLNLQFYCVNTSYLMDNWLQEVPLQGGQLLGTASELKQEGQRCPKRRVAQAAIRLATAVITLKNKERNVRSPS